VPEQAKTVPLPVGSYPSPRVCDDGRSVLSKQQEVKELSE